ncbi:MAG: putative transcriptional regulator [Pseudomonadota bacterium]|nr:putative transcriptional regulator [Pseudomonadota bacterium]
MVDLTNHFLVAMPTQMSSMFAGSVVYVIKHNSDTGAFGVIVNKPLGRTLKNAFKDVDFSKYNPSWEQNRLYLGGPVCGDNGFVLHKTSAASNDNNVFELTNNRSVLSQIAASDSECKSDLFVSVGYSEWAAMQIEFEILRNDWLVVKAGTDLIFDVEPSKRYGEAMRLLGVQNVSHLYHGIGFA